MSVRFVVVAGAAAWASYFINGDDSGIDADEKALADAWLENNAVAMPIDTHCEEGEENAEPYFSWSYGLHTGDDCSGGDLLDYVCEPLKPEDWSEDDFI